jgi:hypothetical protein
MRDRVCTAHGRLLLPAAFGPTRTVRGELVLGVDQRLEPRT